MDGLIIGFIIGYLVRLGIAIWYDEHQTNKEFRKAKIEVDLDKCCKNAYNYGYEIGRLEERVRSDRKLKELYERYANPTREKVRKNDTWT